jgi:hypothetical protein
MLVPEIWCRLKESERDPVKLIREGSLEKLEDFEHNGVLIPAGRLGWRITDIFCYKYLGKNIRRAPDHIQRRYPEAGKTGLDDFADGVLNIVSGHKKAALNYFRDGSVEKAIPPSKRFCISWHTGITTGIPWIRRKCATSLKRRTF